ncbi:MAG: peroxiredoxin Q/BCP [Saprospiraceae bacterium]|jgi:peroxiredoxin Q/BCP
MTKLNPGDKAPAFEGINEKSEPIKLFDYKGKKLILFFYPRDNTPGCTAEACSLRDHFSELKELGYELLGVSPDSPKKHQNFISKFDFPFSLLADTELEVIKSYGVWGRKKFMGREFDGVLRTTFIIDEKGKIERIIDKVKTKDHATQVLDH